MLGSGYVSALVRIILRADPDFFAVLGGILSGS